MNIVKAIQQAAGELSAAESAPGRSRRDHRRPGRLGRAGRGRLSGRHDDDDRSTAPDDPRSRGHGPLGQAQGGPAVHPRRRRVHRRRQPAGQLWLDIVRSPYAHATIKGIDATEALKVPGVAAVVTGKDLEGYEPPLDADPRRRHADGAADRHGHVPGPGGRGGHRDEPLRRRRRRRRGPGRLRAAAGHRRPVQGARAGRVRPPARTAAADKQNNHIWHWESGDKATADAALAAAEVTVSEDIYIPRIHVASIETCGCVADWDPVRQQLTLHMTSQAPHAIRTVLALVAAGAGCRSRAEHPGQDPRHRRRVRRQGAGLPGLRARRRRLVPDRQAGQVDRGPLGEPPGRLVRPRLPHPRRAGRRRRTARSPALKVKTIADHGYTDAAADPSKFPAGLFNVITGSYDFPDAFVEVDGVYTNKPPGGVAYRCSFRVTEAVHAIERMVDILAHDIGKDPAQLRMENFIQPEQFPYKTPTGWEYDSGNYPAALQKAMDMIDYAGLRKEQAEKRARGELMGIGICIVHRDRRRRARRTTSTSSA